MKTVKTLLSVIMFIVYLFAFSKAAFGSDGSDSLIKSKARLINPQLIELVVNIPHKCKSNEVLLEVNFEVVVDKMGSVIEYKLPHCGDRDFQSALIDRIKHLRFIPAISVANVPVPSVVTIKIDYQPEI